MDTPPRLRLISPNVRFGSYLRPLARDFRILCELIAEGRSTGSGVVIDALPSERKDDLRRLVREQGLDLVLDSRSVELSTPVGFARLSEILPLAGPAQHRVDDFNPVAISRFASQLAELAVNMRATGVLAPTHYLDSISSPWLPIDFELARALRSSLDEAGRREISVYYPVVSTLTALSQSTLREPLFSGLQDLVLDGTIASVWLRIHNFGTTSSGPVNLRRYVSFARAAHRLGIPIIGERTGTIGLALLSFGAVGGIESGITLGERYDLSSYFKPRGSGRPFLPPPRVYIPALGISLDQKRARALLSRRGLRNHIACQNSCCSRGTEDTLSNPRRHFVITREQEVNELHGVPISSRAEWFLQEWLTPASHRLTRGINNDPLLRRERDRLDQWRATLWSIREEDLRIAPTLSQILGRSAS